MDLGPAHILVGPLYATTVMLPHPLHPSHLNFQASKSRRNFSKVDFTALSFVLQMKKRGWVSHWAQKGSEKQWLTRSRRSCEKVDPEDLEEILVRLWHPQAVGLGIWASLTWIPEFRKFLLISGLWGHKIWSYYIFYFIICSPCSKNTAKVFSSH